MNIKRQTNRQPNIDKMNGHEFEALVEELVKRMGFSADERKLTADGGIDILAHSNEPFFEGKYIIQCKRYSQKIPESPVRDLYGVVHSSNANKGILITNSNFTKAALDFAKDKQIELIDGTKLRCLLTKYELCMEKLDGVSMNEATTYLFNNFLPIIKKQRQAYENIKNSYVERKPITSQQFISLAIANSENNGDFGDWWKHTMDYFISYLHEKPLDYQKLTEISNQIVKGLQKYLNSYETFCKVAPPPVFLTAHEKLIICADEFSDSIFNIADELERMSDSSKDQLKERMDTDGVIRFNYALAFSGQAMDDATEEFRRACRTAR